MKTTKQKQSLKEASWCEQYHKPNWDGCAANAYFARKCHPDAGASYLNKPKHVIFDRLREIDIANIELIYDIAPLSFQKEKVVNYLTQLTPEKVIVPQNIVHEELYVNTYISAANDILEKIGQRRYTFQK